MNKLYAPENIRKLSECIVDAVVTHQDDRLDSLLNVLKIIVNGPPGERCQSFYGSKVPDDRCLAAVLSSKGVQRALSSDVQKCTQLVDILLGLPYLTHQHCRALGYILTCTQPFPDLRKRLVGSIFRLNDLYKFDLETVSTALKEDKTELEMTLIKLCTQEASTDALSGVNHWIKWCSISAYIFHTLTGLLFELLKVLKCKARVLTWTNLVVKGVRRSCERSNTDFVSLYPVEVQALVDMMVMSTNDGNEDLSRHLEREVRSKFSTLRSKDPSMALILTTHFPEWLDVLGN